MQRYVGGLLFSQDQTNVALVRKNRPAWQAGKLNAIGGKIEPLELPLNAMVREFYEETGVYQNDWQKVAVLKGRDFEVSFFASFGNSIRDVRTVESEAIETWYVATALRDKDLMPNLRVIIPLALDNSGIVKPVFFEDCR